jgi:hypothetical protein
MNQEPPSKCIYFICDNRVSGPYNVKTKEREISSSYQLFEDTSGHEGNESFVG